MRLPSIPRALRALVCVAAAALPLATARVALAQEGGEGPGPDDLGPQIPEEDAELVRLFLEVERNLKRIDELLNDASSGDVPLAAPDDSGLDDLLRSTGRESQEVLSGIDRILEVARQRGQGQPQSGQGQGQPQQSDGPSPLDEPRGGERQQGEATPEGMQPQPKEGGANPQDGEQPDSPDGSDDPGENAPGVEIDQEQGDPRSLDPNADTWGMLPAKVQEIFRNEGAEDLPVQYRDWIDAYYKRLNAIER
jgi:hypothetical protein